MEKHKVKTIVFSSSATVYGNVEEFPEGGLYEGMPVGEGPTSPYGKTKYYIENILADVQKSDKGLLHSH
jgi:UDP-glucose 4-epimerase